MEKLTYTIHKSGQNREKLKRTIYVSGQNREKVRNIVTTLGGNQERWFLAKDVAEWIDYDVKNTYRLLNQVEEEEKSLQRLHTLGGTQEMWFLTEDGLYEVLMQSRKPIAKAFKKEVKKI